MLVLIHVIAALSSLALAGYCVIKPSQTKLKTSYGLSGLTILTGSYLILCDRAHIMSSCLSGLIYLGFLSLAIMKSRQRLQMVKTNIKEK